jgi:hypothetical protein
MSALSIMPSDMGVGILVSGVVPGVQALSWSVSTPEKPLKD